MNRDLNQRRTLLQGIADMFPLFKAQELLQQVKTVERAQYLFDFCKAVKNKDQDARAALRSGCERDIETERLEQLADQEAAAA